MMYFKVLINKIPLQNTVRSDYSKIDAEPGLCNLLNATASNTA